MNLLFRGMRSLRSRVLLPFLLVAAVFASAFIVVALAWTRTQLVDGQTQRAQLLADMLIHAAEASSDAGSLQRIVASVGADRDVLEVIVVGGEPLTVTASTQRQWLRAPISAIDDVELRADLQAGLAARAPQVRVGDQRWFDYSAPIQFEHVGQPVRRLVSGGILVRLDVRPMQRQMRDQALRYLLMLIVALAAYGALIFWHVEREILTPLMRLARRVTQRADAREQVWPEEARSDEFGELAANIRSVLQDQTVVLAQLEHQKFALDQHSIVAVTDVRGRINYVNDKFCAISKYPREEVLGQDHRILNSGHHPKTFFTQMWRTLLRGEVWHGEIRNRAKDGELYWVDTTIVPWIGAAGKPTQFIAIRTDITESRRVKESLQEAKVAAEAASEAKSSFLANMSHEIRTPMNAIIGLTSLLLGTPLQAKQREMLETVRLSSESLLELLNDLLDYSKVEANKAVTEVSPFDVRALIDTAIDLFGPQFGKKRVELIAYVEDGVPTSVMGDPTRFRQILINLISNAFKFTTRGEVEVKVSCIDCNETNAKLLLTVRDTGIGIPEDKFDALFRPFSQVDATTTRRFGGTGLGLAICKRFAELMGGRLWVSSVVGEGSTFSFECTLAKAPSATAWRYPSDRLLGQRILVIEDNACQRDHVCRMLDKCGAQATGADSFARASTLLDTGETWSMIITDDTLVELDPRAAEAETRKALGGTLLPLVIMSTDPAAALSDDAVRVCVAKPLKLYPLVAAIRRALQIQASTSELPLAAADSDDDEALAKELPLRILLAEDNPVNQKVALMMLERLGYEAKVAHDGMQAVSMAHSERFDLILMDVHMPEMDGMTAAREILASSAGTDKRPRIVALTASVLPEERAAAVAAGMHDFLCKPLRAHELARIIRSCVVGTAAEPNGNQVGSANR